MRVERHADVEGFLAQAGAFLGERRRSPRRTRIGYEPVADVEEWRFD